jgi:hypothetical protein
MSACFPRLPKEDNLHPLRGRGSDRRSSFREWSFPGGPVTLEPVDQLVAQLNQLSAEAKQDRCGQVKLGQAGEVLIAHKTEWDQA